MIPKIIHYCWFGGNPLPTMAKRCIKSWKKYCKGYEIREWNESNFDIASAPLYVRQAYEAKKWAFVTDYVRLKVVFDHGGIYLDTDVEIIKPLDELLTNSAYFGFEDASVISAVMEEDGEPQYYVATGLGFGAEKGCSILREMMYDYNDIPFVLPDGSYDQESCPRRNTRVLVRHGLRQDNTLQYLTGGVCILPSHWLCPFEYWSGSGKITEQTVSIHWFNASWMSEDAQKARKKRVKKRKQQERKDFIKYLPNRILIKILGQDRYDVIKGYFKRG